MHSEIVTRWLASIGKDRAWLAVKLSRSEGTVNNWFSQGFPKHAAEIIRLLMAETRQAPSEDSANAVVSISLTWTEMEELHNAASQVGMGLKEFALEAIREAIRRELRDHPMEDTRNGQPPVSLES